MIAILFLLLSIFMIWKGSDWLTDSMIPVAEKLGTNYIAVSSLLVSVMISVPEIIITVYSYFLGHPNIGIGIIVGSVIVNIGLTVGLSAAIRPLKIDKGIAIRDGIYLVVIAVIVMVFGSDLTYTRSEGVTLMLLFIPYAMNVWFFEKHKSLDSKKAKIEKLKSNLDMIGNQLGGNLKPSILTFGLGALVMVLGSYIFSRALIDVGNLFAIPEIIVGMVIGALGTGAPNIAAAIQGTVKGYEDVAITETFGANIFTLLITFGIFIMLNPIHIAAKVFYFDLTWMIFIHVLFLAFIFKGYRFREESITRLEGVILLLFYVSLILINTFAFN
jgi:cation:H+ antiporter